jgi:hypothetical protein
MHITIDHITTTSVSYKKYITKAKDYKVPNQVVYCTAEDQAVLIPIQY